MGLSGECGWQNAESCYLFAYVHAYLNGLAGMRINRKGGKKDVPFCFAIAELAINVFFAFFITWHNPRYRALSRNYRVNLSFFLETYKVQFLLSSLIPL